MLSFLFNSRNQVQKRSVRLAAFAYAISNYSTVWTLGKWEQNERHVFAFPILIIHRWILITGYNEITINHNHHHLKYDHC